MSLGCAAGSCGACCDPVGLSGETQDFIDEWRTWLIDHPAIPDDLDPSVPFAISHWKAYEGPLTETATEDGHRDFLCDKYNRDTRLCEAHEERPPVCSRFPHRIDGTIATYGLYESCSFWLDVPAAERPEYARPLIPIRVIR